MSPEIGRAEHCDYDKYGAAGGGEDDYDIEGQEEGELRKGDGQGEEGEGVVGLGRETEAGIEIIHKSFNLTFLQKKIKLIKAH